MPEYLAKMHKLKSNQEISQLFHRRNYSVNKHPFPYWALGADHEIKQWNRNLKVVGDAKKY